MGTYFTLIHPKASYITNTRKVSAHTHNFKNLYQAWNEQVRNLKFNLQGTPLLSHIVQ